MAKAIESKVGHLKCDTPDCGYYDDTVKREDYQASIGRPCPNCGASLLTQVDYEFLLAMEATVAYLNTLAGEQPDDAARVGVDVKMNGTGKPSFEMRAL